MQDYWRDLEYALHTLENTFESTEAEFESTEADLELLVLGDTN